MRKILLLCLLGLSSANFMVASDGQFHQKEGSCCPAFMNNTVLSDPDEIKRAKDFCEQERPKNENAFSLSTIRSFLKTLFQNNQKADFLEDNICLKIIVNSAHDEDTIISIINALCESGNIINLNHKDNGALHAAFACNKLKVAQDLIKNGFNFLEITDKEWMTAFQYQQMYLNKDVELYDKEDSSYFLNKYKMIANTMIEQVSNQTIYLVLENVDFGSKKREDKVNFLFFPILYSAFANKLLDPEKEGLLDEKDYLYS